MPGKPDESLLIKAVRYTDDGLKMPPKGKLPAAVIADLEAWVAMGRPTRDGATAATPGGHVVGGDRSQTAAAGGACSRSRRRRSARSKDAAWSDHPVDRFLLARLERAGLTPAAPADRAHARSGG